MTDKSSRGTRKGKTAAVAILTGVLVLTGTSTIVAAVDDIGCSVVDEEDMAVEGVAVTLKNLDTTDSTIITTDVTGDCSIGAGTINLQNGDTIELSFTASATKNGCSVNSVTKMSLIVSGDADFQMRFPSVVFTTPSSIDLGKTAVERAANGQIISRAGLGPMQLQGNGNPWGDFNANLDFELVDRVNLGGAGNRAYQFDLHAATVGYYDQDCVWHAVAGLMDSEHTTEANYANNDIVYHSGVSPLTFSPALDADAAGQDSNDRLMQVRMTAHIFECDGVAVLANCIGAGPLDLTVTNDYFVEP